MKSYMTLNAAMLSLAITAAAAARACAAEIMAGVYAHDLGPANREGGADLQLGWRSSPLDGPAILHHASVHVIASANTVVPTDFVAVGLDWTVNLTPSIYLRPGFGLAYTTGKAGLPPANLPGLSPTELGRRLHLYHSRIDFGSHAEFEPELAIGYRMGPKLAVEGSFVHLSNGQILHHGKNQGLDDLGVRLVYGF